MHPDERASNTAKAIVSYPSGNMQKQLNNYNNNKLQHALFIVFLCFGVLKRQGRNEHTCKRN